MGKEGSSTESPQRDESGGRRRDGTSECATWEHASEGVDRAPAEREGKVDQRRVWRVLIHLPDGAEAGLRPTNPNICCFSLLACANDFSVPPSN